MQAETEINLPTNLYDLIVFIANNCSTCCSNCIFIRAHKVILSYQQLPQSHYGCFFNKDTINKKYILKEECPYKILRIPICSKPKSNSMF